MKKWILGIVLLAVLAVRFIVSFSSQNRILKDGQKLRITARVASDPVKFDRSQMVKISGVRVYLPFVPEISYGDEIVVEGVVKDRKINNGKLVEIKEKSKGLFKIKNKIVSFYQSVLPEPFSGLLAGIVLGGRGAITQDFWERVKKAGVSHVVVASGTNVTLVAGFLMSALAVFFKRKIVIPFIILGCILYLFISGFEAPLVRATVMSGVLLVSQEAGRIVSPWKILISTFLVMLLVNPLWANDLGFILSFVSVFSLMLFQKKINERLKILPGVFREGVSTSLAAQIGVFPILFVTFGQFNALSPLINALVLWTVPFIMIIGAIGGLTGLAIPIVGKMIIYLSYPFLWFFGKTVYLFS